MYSGLVVCLGGGGFCDFGCWFAYGLCSFTLWFGGVAVITADLSSSRCFLWVLLGYLLWLGYLDFAFGIVYVS